MSLRLRNDGPPEIDIEAAVHRGVSKVRRRLWTAWMLLGLAVLVPARMISLREGADQVQTVGAANDESTRPATTSTAPMTTTAPERPARHIVWLGESDDLCMTSTSDVPNTPVRVAPCRDDPAMNWQLLSNGQLRGGQGDLCLARTETSDSSPVRAVICDPASDMQIWQVEGDHILNTAPGVTSYLEVDSTDPEREVQLLWRVDGSPAQLWVIR